MPQNIESWFYEYSDELFRWAYHKTSSKEASEDLVQETFLSAVKGVDRFKNNSLPKTWLFAILNNKIVDYYRKKARSFTMDGAYTEQKFIDLTDSFFDSDQRWTIKRGDVLWEEESHILDNMEFRKVMGNCMEKLPENWRLAMISKYLLNKDGKQICQEIKVTPSNYWQIVHRAKLMLKKCIDLNWKM